MTVSTSRRLMRRIELAAEEGGHVVVVLCDVEGGDDHVDRLDPDERRDEPAEAIDE